MEDELLDINNIQLKKEVVIAHKNCYNKSLFGIISRGGVIPINERFSVRLDLLSKDYVNVKIVAHNDGEAPRQQYHRVKKEKVIVEKIVKPKKEKAQSIEIKKEVKKVSVFDYE